MELQQKVDKLIARYRNDPRNKVLVDFSTLQASAAEETGKKISADKLKKVIAAWTNGTLSSPDEAIYDAAVAICGSVARQCFGENPDDDVDYSLDWIENIDGTFTAEVRPSD